MVGEAAPSIRPCGGSLFDAGVPPTHPTPRRPRPVPVAETSVFSVQTESVRVRLRCVDLFLAGRHVEDRAVSRGRLGRLEAALDTALGDGWRNFIDPAEAVRSRLDEAYWCGRRDESVDACDALYAAEADRDRYRARLHQLGESTVLIDMPGSGIAT